MTLENIWLEEKKEYPENVKIRHNVCDVQTMSEAIMQKNDSNVIQIQI